jgi:hypothetical protein
MINLSASITTLHTVQQQNAPTDLDQQSIVGEGRPPKSGAYPLLQHRRVLIVPHLRDAGCRNPAIELRSAPALPQGPHAQARADRDG